MCITFYDFCSFFFFHFFATDHTQLVSEEEAQETMGGKGEQPQGQMRLDEFIPMPVAALHGTKKTPLQLSHTHFHTVPHTPTHFTAPTSYHV